MGLVKSEWIDAQERGWQELDSHVCANCVEDPYLKMVVEDDADSLECDFCGQKTLSNSAAPVTALMGPIASAVFYYFNEPADAGVPYESREGGYAVEPTDIRDVLCSLPLNCNDDLFEAIADAFVNDAWVPAAGGHWASSHPNEEMHASWHSFVYLVKHEVRYFFLHDNAASGDTDNESPGNLLPTIGGLARELGLIRILARDTGFYRVRERAKDATWTLDAGSMSAPPPQIAKAGRMNPAGISYLYMAFDSSTALAEVLHGPPCKCAIAEFHAQRELRVLDLTDLPEEPSVFDDSRRREREGLLFLYKFVEEISQPILKDGWEHVDYVPSQVVSEFFALVFTDGEMGNLDGLVYPSAIRPGGKNIVLFPQERGFLNTFGQVSFQNARELEFASWPALSGAIGNANAQLKRLLD